MNIRFVSSLTAEDENRLAPTLLAAVTAVLDLLALPYVLRIDTSDAKVYEHSRPEALGQPDSGSSRGQIVPMRAGAAENDAIGSQKRW